jgi:hypothetical protein
MDGEQYAGEDVTILGEQSRKDAPQKPDCLAILCRIFSGQWFRRHLLSSEMCRSTGDGNAGKQQREEERCIRVFERGEGTE